MHRYGRAIARIAAPLAAALLALGCRDSLSPERPGPAAPDFSQVGGLPYTATFDAGADGFSYLNDPFRGTAAPAYASGGFSATEGFSGGGLQVLLGGIDDAGVFGMSGGWSADFTLAAPGNVTIALRYQLTQSSEYEGDEYSEALVSVDGVLRGLGGTDRLARLTGDGNGGSPQTTGWQQVEILIPGLAAGTHTVVIGAYNNKKTASNETTELLIDDVAITDPPPGFGDLSITTATTGEGIPAGYTLSVTGPSFPTGSSTTIGASANVTATVGAGDYTVGLSDVPTNCTVSTAAGPNPRTVTVADGGTDNTTFDVTCTATAPGTGTLSITTATTGEGIPAGYTLSATGPSFPTGTSTTVGANANETVTVGAGDYTVGLNDVPSNCTVSTAAGPNPRTVTVPGGGTGPTTFSVTCTATAPTTGTLSVTTATTGQDLPAGYTLTVTGPSFPTGESATIGASATVTVTVNAGDYTVGLSGVPANCTMSTAAGPNPRTVPVPGGGSGSTTFSVTCTATTGTLTVSTSSGGSSIPSSFTVTVDGSQRQSIPATGSVTFTGLSATSHTVVLAGPGNCSVTNGSTSRTVTVPSGATATVSYSVSCTTPNQAPTVSAGSDQTVLLGILYSLSASFSDPDNGPWSYTISWGDGSSSSGSKSSTGTISASHNYILIGSYTIRVTVTDSRGASGSDAKVLTVFTDLPGLPGLPLPGL